VQQTIQIEGVPLHVIDTAGLRDSDDEVERIGIARAWDEIAAADAVLFLHDLSRTTEADYAAADLEIAQTLAERILPSVPVIDVEQDRPGRAGAQMEPLAPLAGRVGGDAPACPPAPARGWMPCASACCRWPAGSPPPKACTSPARAMAGAAGRGAHLQEAHDQLNGPGRRWTCWPRSCAWRSGR
jgi:tRNA modification GTPase